ncbi:MAG: polysaccharide biosynthesis protein, partial [Tissierellia bacterium]|nr:polysaccharide biosynthesis protein [Tissierellia bacterium]
TKRVCEMIVQSYSKHSSTNFSAVRFGNVLGSNGSVIPLFKQQIKEGGPVTITHEKVTRYFMTIPEAVQLVLKAASVAGGGEIFVLDMGEPVKIKDLAYNLIRLSGLVPEEDIKVEYVGLRPGEKLYEELLISNKASQAETGIDKIFIEKPNEFDEKLFFETLEKMMVAAKNNERDRIISLIEKAVPSYNAIPKGQEEFYNVKQSCKQKGVDICS